MDITKNTPAAVIVSSTWRHLAAVTSYIGPSNSPRAKPDGSSSLEAQILDGNDNRGLWIELNTGQEKWPHRPVQKMLIPWQYVLAIVTQPNIEASKGKAGYPQPGSAGDSKR